MINHRVGLLEEGKLINDDIIIENATKTLRLLFFASLVSGKHEANELSSEIVNASTSNSMTSEQDAKICYFMV